MNPPAHVILIQCDDLGFDDLSVNGNPLAYTPNIDRLAANGLQALDFTVNPVCAPSRATLLSGRHFLRAGVSHVHGGKEFLHLDERTMGQAFQAGEWATGMWGKWHLGAEPGYFPWERGFDEAYMAQLYRHRDTLGSLNGERVKHRGWADDVIVDYAIDFLDRAEGPTLLYLPTMTPHGPLDAPEEWVQFHRERGLPENLATLFAMVSDLDEAIGRLVAVLEERNLLEETLIIFTSDNGPAINRGEMTDEERRLRKTSGRRGWKGDIWENGVRAPLIFHWPARLQPGVIGTPMDQIDLLPTLLDWCGLSWPDSYPALDGVSRRALIEAPAEDRMKVEAGPVTYNYAHAGWITSKRVYTPVGIPGEYNPLTPEEKAQLNGLDQPISIREGRWKLLLNPLPPEDLDGPMWQLVDLLDDPGEVLDASEQDPEIFTRLKTKLLAWFEEICAGDHSFTAPVLALGEGHRVIQAKHPIQLSGALQNTVQFLQGWSVVGDVATYQIAVSAPKTTTYEVVLHWRVAPPAGWAFALQAGADTGRGKSDGTSQTKLQGLSIPPAAKALTLSLEEVSTPVTGEPTKLVRLELTPVP